MTREEALALYRSMMLIRRFEERCAQLYVEGKIGGFLHLYVGEADKGRVIGRDGRIANAMRSLLHVASTRAGVRAHLSID